MNAPSPSPSTAAAYQAIWDAAHPPSYTYTIERSCFCELLGPLTVTVRDGRLASIARADGTELKPGDRRLTAYPITIDALFDYAEEAERSSDRSQIGYDPTLGYPAALDIDWDSSIPDDDVTIQVSDLA
jgi:Family of unknown function (DUF6174)